MKKAREHKRLLKSQIKKKKHPYIGSSLLTNTFHCKGPQQVQLTCEQ